MCPKKDERDESEREHMELGRWTENEIVSKSDKEAEAKKVWGRINMYRFKEEGEWWGERRFSGAISEQDEETNEQEAPEMNREEKVLIVSGGAPEKKGFRHEQLLSVVRMAEARDEKNVRMSKEPEHKVGGKNLVALHYSMFGRGEEKKRENKPFASTSTHTHTRKKF
jgi:hypothetical protein